MFRKEVLLSLSLMRASQFAQKKVCKVARAADVADDGGATKFAGVVYQQITETE